MYQLKKHPEDFIVREITNLSFKDSGNYLVCILKKKDYTTIRAVEQIAKSLGVKVKDIGFAGIKDKNAVTEQYISVKGVYREDIGEVKLKDIELKIVGYLDKPISLGDLEGNEFVITIRELQKKEMQGLEKKIKGKCLMPNYFGEQRFSKHNVEIGKSLLKSDFKKALKLILKTDIDYEKEIKESIKDKPNDFVRALKLIPKKLLKLYVHAYQSYLWNRCLEEYIKVGGVKGAKIPLIGFGTEIDDEKVEGIVDKVMDEEKVGFRSFINRSIPEISLEGDMRDAFVEIKEFKVLDKGKDFVKIGFVLPKGSYATVGVDFLLN